MSKKISIVAIFVASVLVNLSLFNHESSLAQTGHQEFLDSVYNRSRNTCRPSGSQCSNCAENLAKQIIKQKRITNPRVQNEVYNAALKACN